MKVRYLFIIAIIGILAGIMSYFIYNQKVKVLPPISVDYNPYESGIYATGIVESSQANGSNVNIFPEISGKVIKVYSTDGKSIKKGDPIIGVDDSVQRQIVEKDQAQIAYAQANLVNVQAQLDKNQKAYSINPKSVSLNDLDNAINAVKMAKENVRVAQAQYRSDKALLDKYIVTSPIDGVILRIACTMGDYVSPLGSYDLYSQVMIPSVQLGVVTPVMQVRAYVNELLTPRLPESSKLQATMFIRGLKNKSIPLTFYNIQPYTIPNIELSDQRNERVDVRVLPIIFKFEKPNDVNIFPGQLVDIYIKGNK